MQHARSVTLAVLLGLACRHDATAPTRETSTPKPALSQTAFEQEIVAAVAAYGSGDHAACLDRFRPLIDDPRALQDIAYNAACCAALAGETDEALELLARAIDRGFRDVDHLERDRDLASLHKLGGWGSIVARAREAWDHHERSLEPELARMFREDQADRLTGGAPIDWSVVAPRDVERRRRVIELMDAGVAKAADDFYHAAMVLQHGESAEDYERARQWAERALELEPNHGPARWLASAALDRYLMNLGKPQKFGTQYVQVDGVWKLYDYDASVTDEQRAAAGVPPLAEAKAQVERLNAGTAR